MALTAKRTEHADFEICPAGNYAARCYSMIDLGICAKGGAYPGESHQMRWAFELSETMADGKPFSISEKLTVSLHEKARLYQRLISWRGRAFTDEELEGFDLKKVAGAPCLINVVHTKSKDGAKTYANIASISPLPKGMQAPELVNPKLVWEFGDDESRLPDWARKMLGRDPNEPAYSDNVIPMHDDDDDIPF